MVSRTHIRLQYLILSICAQRCNTSTNISDPNVTTTIIINEMIIISTMVHQWLLQVIEFYSLWFISRSAKISYKQLVARLIQISSQPAWWIYPPSVQWSLNNLQILIMNHNLWLKDSRYFFQSNAHSKQYTTVINGHVNGHYSEWTSKCFIRTKKNFIIS